MPRGPGIQEPKPIEPWRSYLLATIDAGSKEFTYIAKDDDAALEAKRGFFRAAVGGSMHSLKNSGYKISVKVSVTDYEPPVSLRKKGWQQRRLVTVKIYTRAAARRWVKTHQAYDPRAAA